MKDLYKGYISTPYVLDWLGNYVHVWWGTREAQQNVQSKADIKISQTLNMLPYPHTNQCPEGSIVDSSNWAQSLSNHCLTYGIRKYFGCDKNILKLNNGNHYTTLWISWKSLYIYNSFIVCKLCISKYAKKEEVQTEVSF